MRLRAPGWAILITLVLLLMAAWNTGTNLFYLLVGGLSSFLLISFVLARWVLRKVELTREAPGAVHRGEPFGVTVRVENRKRIVPVVSLRIEHAEYPGETAAFILKIPPQRAAVVRMSETFEKRGVYNLPDVEVVCAFPFGLFEKRRREREAVEVVVYPRVTAVRATALSQLPGARAVPRRSLAEGEEFFSLRDYVRGDDLRRVAWRVSARRGSLVVREMAHGTSRFMVFVLDTFRSMDMNDFEERFEDAIELVASLAVTLLNQHYTVAITTPGARLPGGEGRPHADKVLDMLARLNPTDDPEKRDFAWFSPQENTGIATHVLVSPDPRQWGRADLPGGSRVLDPREIIRA